MRLLMVALALLIASIACAAEPLPTYLPLPTLAPPATLEPLPTSTPYPTLVPLPTHTPAPTPTAVVITTIKQNNWIRQPRFGGKDAYTTVNSSELGEISYGPWWLMVTCDRGGAPGVFVGQVMGEIFEGLDGTDSFPQSVLVALDGVSVERTWTYFPSTTTGGDYIDSGWGAVLIRDLLEAETLDLVIPASIQDYTIGFRVAGLSEHISNPEEVCES